MSILTTKLELACLAINGNRYEEAEKLIQDVLFEPSASDEEKVSSWIALGSLKSILFNQEKANFDEVVYCFKKAQEVVPSSNPEILTSYFSVLISVVYYNSELITAAKIRKGQAEDSARFSATVGVISGLVAVNSSSTLWKAAGIAGAGIGANGYLSGLKDSSQLGQIIEQAQMRISRVFNGFAIGMNIPQEVVNEFQAKIIQNEKIAKQLGFKDTQALAAIAKEYSDLVITKEALEKKISSGGFFSAMSMSLLKKHRADILPLLDKTYFALEEAYGAIIFCDDKLLLIKNTNKLIGTTVAIEVAYKELRTSGFRCFQSGLGQFNLELSYRGVKYVINNPLPLTAVHKLNYSQRATSLANAIENALI